MLLRDYINSIFLLTFNFSLILHKTYSIYTANNNTITESYLYKGNHKLVTPTVRSKAIPII